LAFSYPSKKARRSGRRRTRPRLILLLVVGFGLVFAAGDGRELVHQLDESNAGIAVIAAILSACTWPWPRSRPPSSCAVRTPADPRRPNRPPNAKRCRLARLFPGGPAP
jgi:hypothetical protein